MEDLEIIEVEIKDLKNAYANIIEAMNNLKDVDGLDEEYKQLDIILEAIDDKRIDLESEEEDLKEQQCYKANKKQWQKEKRQQDLEYESIKL